MSIRTPVCDLLGIDVPIVSAGMGGGTAGPALAAAVSEAGGLGTIGGIDRRGPEQLRNWIRETRERTSKPFSVNIWVFVLQQAPAFLDVCLEERVPSATLSFGDPTPYVARIRDAGVRLLHQAQTIAGVKQAADAGVDAIIAQGGEAGGHTGSVGTLALIPQAVDAAAGRPVLAAGGIADGRGLAAALALGAQGIVMGTRFVAAEEATTHAGHQENVLAATADDTVYGDVFDIIDGLRWPAGIHGRSVRTPFAAEWQDREDELRQQRDAILAESTQPGEAPERAFSAYAGQASGLIRQVKPAAEIIGDVMREAEEVLESLRRLRG